MIGDRIKLARKKAGFSLRDLATALDGLVTAQAIGKYERGEMTPSSTVLIALSKALGVSMTYLLSPEEISLGRVEFRKLASTRAADRARVQTEVLEWLERYLQIEKILDLGITAWKLPKCGREPVSSPEDAEAIADRLREEWDIGIDPLPNVTELLEEKGIKVLLIELPEKVSGLTCHVERPRQKSLSIVVVVNKTHPLERRRFTLAHELAHQVLKLEGLSGSDGEKLCNRFAGAFLVPKEHLLKEVGERRKAFGYQEIVSLKRFYRVSAATLLMRLHQIDVIDQSSLEWAFRTYAKDWRKNEPNAIEESHHDRREKPKRFERLTYRALAERMISMPKASELLRIPVDEVQLGMKGPEAIASHR